MKIQIFVVLAVFSAIVNCADPNVDGKFEDDKNDNSVFDKILKINQKAAKARSGGPQPKLFEGDIVKSQGRKRGATNNAAGLWPTVNGYREVPYILDNSVGNIRWSIYGAMREWMTKVSCIKFVPRTNQPSYLRFYAGSGCSSAVGRQGGGQYVSLGRGCGSHGIIVHEIGHALGFWHEQSRPDRDSHIFIYWKNIYPNMKYNFAINNGIDSRGVGYDYSSIMHYGPKAFSKNGGDTILANNGKHIGQRQGLSKDDVKQAKLMYGCSGTINPTTPSTTPSSCSNDLDKNCKSWAQSGYCTNQKHRSYMLINCKRSCCVNKDTRCTSWITNLGQKECQRNPLYMLYQCGESCNNCKC